MINESSKKSVVLFDLDGTVTDPYAGIAGSVAYALEKLGLPVPDRSVLARYIGPPLRQSFRDGGLSDDDSERAVTYYREYFSEKGIMENAIYPGMSELIHDLNKAGKTVLLATFKPTVYAERILDRLGVLKYFTFVSGVSLADDFLTKTGIIKRALECTDIADPGACVMVGDRCHDIIAANEAGMDSIGVLFGYGSREELTDAGATWLADSVSALRELLM